MRAILATRHQPASTTSYKITVFAGYGSTTPANGVAAVSARFSEPEGLAIDTAGNLYFADAQAFRIYKINTSGTITIMAGTGTSGSPTAGPATSSKLGMPTGIAVDPSGNLYVADYVKSYIYKINTSGTLSIFAGIGTFGTAVPGPATSSGLGNPQCMATDSAGNIYVADSHNNQIYKITAAGTLSIFAGTGATGAPTTGPATSSKLGDVFGVGVDSAGNVYIGDSANAQVYKVNTSGTLSVFAGTGTAGNATNGPATSSKLLSPWGVRADAAGNVYIADNSGYAYKVDTSGTLSIIAGGGVTAPSTTPILGTSADLSDYIYDTAVDASGNVYVSDYDRGYIYKIAT